MILEASRNEAPRPRYIRASPGQADKIFRRQPPSCELQPGERAYSPPSATSASWLPWPTIRPSPKTRIRAVGFLHRGQPVCATNIVCSRGGRRWGGGSFVSSSTSAMHQFSLASASSALRRSSSSSNGRHRHRIASRPVGERCFCPPDCITPLQFPHRHRCQLPVSAACTEIHCGGVRRSRPLRNLLGIRGVGPAEAYILARFLAKDHWVLPATISAIWARKLIARTACRILANSSRTAPDAGRRNRNSCFHRCLSPAFEGPTRPTCFPGATVRLTLSQRLLSGSRCCIPEVANIRLRRSLRALVRHVRLGASGSRTRSMNASPIRPDQFGRAAAQRDLSHFAPDLGHGRPPLGHHHRIR